jgi:hypothetical protein
MNVHWMVLYNLKVFCSDIKFKMATTAGLSLTLDPKFGFSQFISFREEDLWNFSQSEHIIAPGSHIEYPTGTKNSNFVEDFLVSLGVRRLLSVVCKLFTFQASSPKPQGWLEPRLAGMFLGWSSTRLLFFVPVGYSISLPGAIICSDWLKFQRSSSLKLMNWLNPNCKGRQVMTIVHLTFGPGELKMLFPYPIFPLQ